MEIIFFTMLLRFVQARLHRYSFSKRISLQLTKHLSAIDNVLHVYIRHFDYTTIRLQGAHTQFHGGIFMC